MSATYLNSSVTEDDDNLQISDYDLIRIDHPCNSKRGGVPVYYKNVLPPGLRDINYLRESIRYEIQIGSKTADNFDSFLTD